MIRWTPALSLVMLALVPQTSAAADPDPSYHPWAHAPQGARTIDVRTLVPQTEARPAPRSPSFDQLDDFRNPDAPPPSTEPRSGPSRLPEGWVQRGGVVVPAPIANGAKQVDLDPSAAFEDIPGNKYPRKHTLYMNFVGGPLHETFGGLDNSAEDISVLALEGNYPVYEGGEQKAIAAAEATQNDLALVGVRVVYLERPPKILPYTMAMIGGTWEDTNLDSPAGGVAPIADCGALNQRHIVYVFASGGMGATSVANVTSQEAGHAWGLDHTLNCGSVMSYCGSGDQVFSDTCDELCEATCQGPNSIGCRLAHEEICGVDTNRQNEVAELQYLFGTSDPDIEPPIVEIDEPMDGAEVEPGADIQLRAFIEDDYGGMGWSTTILRDGEVLLDEIDYYKENLGDDLRVAYNLTNIPAGVYTITVTAMDHADHVTTDTVTIYVGVEAGDTGLDDTGGTGLPGGTAGTEGTAGDGATGDSGVLEQDDDGGGKGCACTAGAPRDGRSSAWLLGLLGPWVWRRRR